MSRFRLLVCLVATTVVLACSYPAPAAILLGHWQLEETSTDMGAVDSSGTNPPGVYGTGEDGGVDPDVLGPLGFGSAARFAADGYDVNVGAGSTLGLQNNFTVTAWARFDNVSGKHSILGNPGWAVRSSGSAPQITTFGVLDYTGTSDTLQPNRWTHVAVVLDASNDAQFYVNGQPAGLVSHTSPANPNAADFAIGARSPGNASESMVGVIDDVRFYSGTLTQEEVREVMTDYTGRTPQIINPVSVRLDAGSEYSAYVTENLINDSGLSDTVTVLNYQDVTHAGSGSTNSWVTDALYPDYFSAGGEPPVLTFDLGGYYALSDVLAWNYSVVGNATRSLLAEFSTAGMDGPFGNPVLLV